MFVIVAVLELEGYGIHRAGSDHHKGGKDDLGGPDAGLCHIL